MMIDKRLINTVADSKKWIGITVLWNWVALIGGIISAVVFSYILQAAYFNELGPLSAVIFSDIFEYQTKRLDLLSTHSFQ